MGDTKQLEKIAERILYVEENLSSLEHKLFNQQRPPILKGKKKLLGCSLTLSDTMSWLELRCHASAVHHGKNKTHCQTMASMKEDREWNRAHIQTWWSLHNSTWQKEQKPPGDPGGSRAFSTCFMLNFPLETTRLPSCVYSFERKREGALWAAAVKAATESSSHQGAGRGREQMLIGGWSLRIARGYD